METFGTGSQSANQEQYLQEILEMATMALSNLISQLGKVLEGLETQLNTLTKRNENLQSNSIPNEDSNRGQAVVKSSDSGDKY